jgi:hypothetical protein
MLVKDALAERILLTEYLRLVARPASGERESANPAEQIDMA